MPDNDTNLNSNFSFFILPADVIKHQFSYMDSLSILTAIRTNKQFRSYACYGYQCIFKRKDTFSTKVQITLLQNWLLNSELITAPNNIKIMQQALEQFSVRFKFDPDREAEAYIRLLTLAITGHLILSDRDNPSETQTTILKIARQAKFIASGHEDNTIVLLANYIEKIAHTDSKTILQKLLAITNANNHEDQKWGFISTDDLILAQLSLPPKWQTTSTENQSSKDSSSTDTFCESLQHILKTDDDETAFPPSWAQRWIEIPWKQQENFLNEIMNNFEQKPNRYIKFLAVIAPALSSRAIRLLTPISTHLLKHLENSRKKNDSLIFLLQVIPPQYDENNESPGFRLIIKTLMDKYHLILQQLFKPHTGSLLATFLNQGTPKDIEASIRVIGKHIKAKEISLPANANIIIQALLEILRNTPEKIAACSSAIVEAISLFPFGDKEFKSKISADIVLELMTLLIQYGKEPTQSAKCIDFLHQHYEEEITTNYRQLYIVLDGKLNDSHGKPLLFLSEEEIPKNRNNCNTM